MRTAIITGANSGLGFDCARSLLNGDSSWHVVLAVRDVRRGADAVERLGRPRRCSVLELDLASLESVRRFADRVRAADLPPLHAVVCNAGVQVVSGSQTTVDGFEMTFGVNHLGHFALVQGLLAGGLERSDPGSCAVLARPARIVVVSSGTHDPSRHTGMPAPRYTSAAELAAAPAGDAGSTEGRRRYTTSKLCNVLFTYELDRRLDCGARGVAVNAFDPGLMPGTGLSRDYSPVQRLAWRLLSPLLNLLPQVHSSATSGARLAALSADPRFDTVTGQYFVGLLKAVPSSADSYDLDKARDLWQTSERLAMNAT